MTRPTMAFLGQDGWKSGLPSEALRKVEELENSANRLEKERAQRQIRMETIEQALDKQKQKTEDEKQNSSQLSREVQSLRESCDELQRHCDKLRHELGTKDNQNSNLQGQLDARTKRLEDVTNKLKKAERSVEDYENAGMPASQFGAFATPQKRESLSHRAALNTSARSFASDDSEDKVSALQRQLEEMHKRMEDKDREVKDMEAKLFEKSVSYTVHITSNSSFNYSSLILQLSPSMSNFDEQPVGGSSILSNPFDDTPLPTATKEAKFGTIADRAKSSSIAFNYQVCIVLRVLCHAYVFLKKTPLFFQKATPPNNAGKTRAPMSSVESSGGSTASNSEALKKVKEQETVILRLNREKQELAGTVGTLENKVGEKEREMTGKLATAREEAARHREEADRAAAKVAQLESRVKDLQTDFECQRHNSEATKANLEKKVKEQVSLKEII